MKEMSIQSLRDWHTLEMGKLRNFQTKHEAVARTFVRNPVNRFAEFSKAQAFKQMADFHLKAAELLTEVFYDPQFTLCPPLLNVGVVELAHGYSPQADTGHLLGYDDDVMPRHSNGAPMYAEDGSALDQDVQVLKTRSLGIDVFLKNLDAAIPLPRMETFAPDGTLLDENGNRSIFDDVDE